MGGGGCQRTAPSARSRTNWRALRRCRRWRMRLRLDRANHLGNVRRLGTGCGLAGGAHSCAAELDGRGERCEREKIDRENGAGRRPSKIREKICTREKRPATHATGHGVTKDLQIYRTLLHLAHLFRSALFLNFIIDHMKKGIFFFLNSFSYHMKKGIQKNDMIEISLFFFFCAIFWRRAWRRATRPADAALT